VTNEELLTVLEARFQRLETDVRHTRVQIESVYDETRRIAESVILVDEKLERFRADTNAAFDEQKAFNQMLIRRLEAM
jgi:hypothetical protein